MYVEFYSRNSWNWNKTKKDSLASNSLHVPLHENDLKSESDINDLKKQKWHFTCTLLLQRPEITLTKKNKCLYPSSTVSKITTGFEHYGVLLPYDFRAHPCFQSIDTATDLIHLVII